MTATGEHGWPHEFGIHSDMSRLFVSRTSDLNSGNVPHAHVVRKAFDLLSLDAVLCDQEAPLVYFKLVSNHERQRVAELHRQFWNHGGVPVLALVSATQVQILSSFARPDVGFRAGDLASVVSTLPRRSPELRELLPALESGEFFRRHARSFDPSERVDHALLDNLKATRERLAEVDSGRATGPVLDAFLCRLVFTCYLFDREIIGAKYLNSVGITDASHLRDVLSLQPRSRAKSSLYRLFVQLARDFNGDTFNDDLNAEASLLSVAHIDEVSAFFRGTDVRTRQASFWPYDFKFIPIETISAIYERFLQNEHREAGSFYTPRFLAEIVLDLALSDRDSLLQLRFLDPACGSGIFLVGLFNRMAEEWRRANPKAGNDRRARELLEILRTRLVGIDLNPTACKITAFSLCLAYLDQLSPRDIQDLQARGAALPRLVRTPTHDDHASLNGSVIHCDDFFREGASFPSGVDVVVGNPPWGSIAGPNSSAARWCQRQNRAIPDSQIATAFMWKGVAHAAENGHVCFVLPHGVLFNHSKSALAFQRSFVQAVSVSLVLNLTDYQAFLFSEARHPALVMKYSGEPPQRDHALEYWVPRADWKVTRAEMIAITERDRQTVRLSAILRDLDDVDAPQVWKRFAWASQRDRRLLARLAGLPRLRDSVRQPREAANHKPWLIAEGFQPFGDNDPHSSRRALELPSRAFIPATSPHIQLFLLPEDCEQRTSMTVVTRRMIRDTGIFRAPHVLVSKGYGSIAFADFDVSFQHALRGISGPKADRALLMFLAAYMRSALAKYFLFHTSSNWGVSRQEVHVEEVLRLPFPLPADRPNAGRAQAIVDQVASHIEQAMRAAVQPMTDHGDLVESAQACIEPMVFEYFDVIEAERVLIADTLAVAVPSFRPSRDRAVVPSLELASGDDCDRYNERLCETLNSWTRRDEHTVIGSAVSSQSMGVGIIALENSRPGADRPHGVRASVLGLLAQIQQAVSTRLNVIEIVRGLKVFDGSRLYIVKPLGRAHWTESAALNDADEIASTILMQNPERAR